MNNKLSTRERLTEIASIILGSLIYAIGFNVFLLPHGIVMGGATGAATVLNILFGFPTGVVIMLINVPLILIYVFRLKGPLFHSVVGIVLTSVFIDVFSFLPSLTSDSFVGAVFGGIVMGGGVGLLLLHGYSTGGSDLAAIIIHQKLRSVSVGNIILMIDSVVIASAAAATGKWEGILYSLITAYAYSLALDVVTGGASSGKLALILSSESDAMADVISKEVGRGVTLLYGRGWYSGDQRQVIMCVVKRGELYRLRRAVKETDPGAFVVFSDVSEVLGKGFSISRSAVTDKENSQNNNS